MAKNVQHIGDALPNAGTRVGLDRQITIDTTAHSIRVHDGATAGGFETARADGNNIPNSAAITWRNALALSSIVTASANKLNGTAAPTASNDVTQGYVIGSMWVDTVGHKIYFCMNNAVGAAIWWDGAVDLSPYALNTALTAEVSARSSADSTLQTNITNEVIARQADTATRALVNLSNVTNADFLSKATASGVGAGITVQQSPVTYVVSGGTTTISARTILSVNEQSAGQAFDLTYNTRSDYIEQDSIAGTDAISGTFQLHLLSSGGLQDKDTIYLTHADGYNGSNDIVDDRSSNVWGGGAAYFDGSSYVTVPTTYKLAFAGKPYTFECWFKITAGTGGWASILSASTDFNFGVALNTSSNKINYWLGNGSTWSLLNGSVGSITVALNTWTHFAWSYDGTTMRAYINGVQDYAVTVAGGFSSATGLTLGRFGVGAYSMTGWLGQIRVSNIARYVTGFTAPSAAITTDANTAYMFTFQDGYGSQLMRDSSNSGCELRVFGGSIDTTRSKFGSSSFINSSSNTGGIVGNASKPNTNFLLGSDDFTVDFWYYPAGTPTSNARFLLLLSDTSEFGLSIRHNTDGTVGVYFSSNGTSYNLANNLSLGVATNSTWNHLAITRSGTSIYCFLNGTLAQTVAVGTSSISTSTTGYFHLGGRTDNSIYSISGSIDEFRIKRGQAVWTSSFTVPTAAYTSDSQTILLCHFDGASGDKVTFDSSESSYGDVYTPAIVFTGSAALDATYTRGGNSTSLKLNGTSQYALVSFSTPTAGNPIYFANWEQYCIEGWVYLSTLSGAPVLFNIVGASNTTTGNLHLWYDSSSSTWIYSISASATVLASSVSTTAVGWVHLAVVRDGRGYTVYVNGAGATTTNQQTNISYTNESYNLFIGAYHGSSNYVTGAIDSFRITHGKPRYTANFTPGNLAQDTDTTFLYIFNGSVGQKWVKELSKNTTAVAVASARVVQDGFYSPPTTTQPTISTGQYKFGAGSLTFNGTTQYVDLPTPTNSWFSGDFTVDMWVRLNDIGTLRCLLSKSSATDSNKVLYLERRTDNKIYATMFNSGGATHVQLSSTTTTAANTWYHVAFAVSGTTAYLFVNGTLEAFATTSGTRASNTNVTSIGSYWDGSSHSEYFNGYIDELRISAVARWTATFTPPVTSYGTPIYVTGPYYVTTSNTSQINLTGYSGINNVAFTQITNSGTSIKYLVSFDGRTTWKYWTGSAWTTSSLANIDVNGVSSSVMTSGLLTWTPALGSTIDVAASLKTTNVNNTPVLDNVTVITSGYTQMQPKVDYTVTQPTATGVQTVTFKRLSAGAANHIINYI